MKKVIPCVALIAAVALSLLSCKKSDNSPGSSGNPDSTGNHVVNAGGAIVSTVATSSGSSVFNGGPHGICADQSGNIYFTTDNYKLIRMDGTGALSLLAGGSSGCETGQGSAATFTSPVDICAGPNGNLFVVDMNCPGIKTITTGGLSSLFCASDASNNINLASPTAVGADNKGNIYAGGQIGTDGITIVDPNGKASHLAGNGTLGSADGANQAAEFQGSSGICVNSNGDVYVADGHVIRKISGGQVTTLAGGASDGFKDGQGTAAAFAGAMGICLDAAGNLFVADPYNQAIRKVTPDGLVTTIAGSAVSGYKDGDAGVALFSAPTHCCVDASGNLYVSDLGSGGDLNGSGYIRKITFKKP